MDMIFLEACCTVASGAFSVTVFELEIGGSSMVYVLLVGH